MRVGDVHALVRRAHVAARVHARTARALANLIDEILLESWNVRAGEKAVDPVVGGDVADEIVDDGRDRGLTTQAVVNGFLRCHRLH